MIKLIMNFQRDVKVNLIVPNRLPKALFYVALLVVLSALVSQPVLSANGMDRLNHSSDNMSFDRFVQKSLEDYEVPGAVVVVVENNTTVFLKGYGVREIGKPELVDKDTRFQIGSNSKLFTAAALGVLVDEGKIDWDTPLIEYMPDFVMNDSYAAFHATLRDMLAHRSGLRAYDGDLFNRLNYSRPEVLHRVRYMKPGHSFREKWAYSNLGIFLAGEAGARIDNSTWEEVLSSRILKPLGMDRSGPNLNEMFKDDNHASAHNIDNTTMPYERVDKLGAAGSVVSTGADMAQWLRMLLAEGSFEGRQILKPKTVQEIIAASMMEGMSGPLMDPNGAACLGCDSYDFLGYKVVEKNGALDGFRSIVTLVPEKKIGIAIVANKQLTAFPEAVRAEFLERYLGPSGRDLQAQIHDEQAAWNSLLALPPLPQKPNPTSKDLEAYAGNYTSKVYGQLSVFKNDSSLGVEVGPSRYKGLLQHWSDNTFLLTFPDPDDAPGLITFVIGPSGNITGFNGEDYRFGLMANYGHFEKI